MNRLPAHCRFRRSLANRLEELMKVNRKITMMALAGLALSGLTLIGSGDAALAEDTVRVRGAIESIDGSTYVIRAREIGRAHV